MFVFFRACASSIKSAFDARMIESTAATIESSVERSSLAAHYDQVREPRERWSGLIYLKKMGHLQCVDRVPRLVGRRFPVLSNPGMCPHWSAVVGPTTTLPLLTTTQASFAPPSKHKKC